MTYTLKRYQTFQEYLNAEELSEERNYRLLNTGEVIELATESELNRIIMLAFILAIQKAKGSSFIRFICNGNKDLQVNPVGDKWVNRKPDIMVLTPAHLEAAEQAIFLGAPAPAFVAEIVSPGGPSSDSYLRDYVWKREQYEWWQISEYWIIDPRRGQVSVLTLVDGAYQETVYKGEDAITSITFPKIDLTVSRLITGKIDD
ncbi:MAG: Uma2 family endonuclease [Cyanobacteria bacterium P01_C01_bin.69]